MRGRASLAGRAARYQTNDSEEQMQDLNSPQSAIPTEFDAKAQQRIPIQVEVDGETFEVVHVFDPYDNTDRMVEYCKRLKSVLLPSEVKGGVASESETFEANVWLWDKLAVGMEGRGEPGEPLPEDWKEQVDDEEKNFAINQLLGTQAVAVAAKASDRRLAWGQRATHVAVPLIVRFGPYQIRVVHHMKKNSAAQASLYERLTSRREHVPGSRLNQSETWLPTAARDLYDLYLEMQESVEKYKDGVVPLPHALVVLRNVFSGGMESKVKNSTASPKLSPSA